MGRLVLKMSYRPDDSNMDVITVRYIAPELVERLKGFPSGKVFAQDGRTEWTLQTDNCLTVSTSKRRLGMGGYTGAGEDTAAYRESRDAIGKLVQAINRMFYSNSEVDIDEVWWRE